MGEDDDEDDRQDAERDQGSRVEEAVTERGVLSARRRRYRGGLHIALQHTNVSFNPNVGFSVRTRKALVGDLAATNNPFE